MLHIYILSYVLGHKIKRPATPLEKCIKKAFSLSAARLGLGGIKTIDFQWCHIFAFIERFTFRAASPTLGGTPADSRP